MKKRSFIFLAFCFWAVCAAAQMPNFKIEIIQDSVCPPGANNTVLIAKKPFKIAVTLTQTEGVYVYAAFKDSIYKIKPSAAVPGFKNIPALSMAEETYNTNQELIIDDEGWAYWFYTPNENWHRFDKDVIVENKVVKATKSVKQFYFPAGEKTVSISNVTAPLYLFFFTATENANNELDKELQRYKIKIVWK